MTRKMQLVSALILILALCTVLAAGCGSKEEAQGDTAVPVTVITLAPKAIERVISPSGEVAASEEVSLVPKAGGKVASVPVEVGDRVKKGQVLVKLEDDVAGASLLQARADLEAARIAAEAAAVSYENAKADFNRTEALYKEGAVSQQALEQARLQLKTADPAAARARVKQAEAGLAMAQSQYDATIITSPVDGMVATRLVDPGEMANAGAPVMSVVNIDQVKVEVGIPEGEINYIQPGQGVEVAISAGSWRPVPGKVKSVAPAADSMKKTFAVTVELDNPQHTVKPGMFATVTFPVQRKENVLAVPPQAVVERGGQTVVYTVEDDKAKEVPVIKGLETPGQVEIATGLKAGDRVIVVGQDNLSDGVKVNAVEGR